MMFLYEHITGCFGEFNYRTGKLFPQNDKNSPQEYMKHILSKHVALESKGCLCIFVKTGL